ncbi:MAG: Peptidoglycan O-acetyltransferase [Anaerolineae bacterium]|nr:Peptidoglycan O-acetyltransferase [Anaerolineae bacterium]
MLFNSYEFIFLFLPVVLVVYWSIAVRQRNWRLLWLTLASYYFYAFWNYKFLALIIASTAIDYWVGPKIYAAQDIRTRRAWLSVSLLSNLGGLAFFKYYNFAADQINGLGGMFGLDYLAPVLNVALPIGISFTAFESLSYTIDLYRGQVKPARDFLVLACFVSVFPRMIAGPIIRYAPFAPQLERDPRTRAHADDAMNGIYFFVVGLAKKVLVADVIAGYINPLLTGNAYLQLGLLGSWGVMLGYSFQLLFDFSGYSDMAVGLGKTLGLDLPQNFNSPYKAASIIDFWRRWHMTLSSWLRDYLYIPLGGNRHGEFATMRNLMLTMALGGLWHGANWTFVLWGFYHGIWLVLNHQAAKLRLETTRFKFLLHPAPTRAATFIIVVFGWVLFRSDNLAMALYLWQSMLGLHGIDWHNLHTLSYGFWAMLGVGFGLAMFAPNTWQIKITPKLRYAIILGMLAAVCVLMLGQRSPFLYFQF